MGIYATAAAPRRNADMRLVFSVVLLFILITTVMFLTSIPGVIIPFRDFITYSFSPQTPTTSSGASHLHRMEPDVYNGSVIKRSFLPVGTGSYLFVALSGYRGGANTFALVGLGSKTVQHFAPPAFHCHWFPHNTTSNSFSSSSVTAPGFSYTPDWGMGRVYSVYVVNCTFPSPVGADGSGGRLVVREVADGGGELQEQHILALEEAPGSLDTTLLTAPPKHDYLYCGPRMYGDLSPQRMREWMAYHVRLFGMRSHFVFYDDGGLHAGVMGVLQPWIERGFITIYDIRDQKRYDSFNRNHFLLLNDCLLRHRLLANWIFFFDVDEYIYIDPNTNLQSLLHSLSKYTQVIFDQEIMSRTLCDAGDAGRTPEMWGFEKLLYTRPPTAFHKDHDRKYVVRPRSTMSAGVHRSESINGETYGQSDERIRYFHYHGMISDRRDPCREFREGNEVNIGNTNFTRDDRLRRLAGAVKDFERSVIGSVLEGTRE